MRKSARVFPTNPRLTGVMDGKVKHGLRIFSASAFRPPPINALWKDKDPQNRSGPQEDGVLRRLTSSLL